VNANGMRWKLRFSLEKCCTIFHTEVNVIKAHAVEDTAIENKK
jgi:hypothetical protein